MKVFLKQNMAIIIILLIGIILRLYKLDFQSAWVDELFTLSSTNLNLTFNEMHELLILREGFPHFYFLLVKLFSFLFGHEIIVVRVISSIFGVLSILYIYKIGNLIYSKNVGLFSALMLSLHSFAIEHSQEGRVYSILMFFTIISFYYLIRFLKDLKLKDAIWMGIFTGMIINSQPIGIVHVASIYFIVFLFLFINNSNWKKIFKYSLLSGLISLLFLLIASSMIFKVSNITSHWIPELNVSFFYLMMEIVLGKSAFMFWLNVFGFVIFNVIYLRKLFSKNNEPYKILTFTILNIWILFFLLAIILKSHFDISIFLHRYLIGIIPPFILMISIAVYNLKNRFLSHLIVASLSIYMFYLHVFKIEYYNTLFKSQYDLVAKEIIKRPTENTKIVSKWEFILGYYFNKDNGFSTIEYDLNTYVDQIRNGSIKPISFWYMDGNSNQLNLTSENEIFIKNNFVVKHSIKKFDAWAIYYDSKVKNKDLNYFDLNNFKNGLFDGQGQLVITSNNKYIYPEIKLDNGKYLLKIIIQSLPDPPLNNINANFNLLINNQNISNFYASEKEDQLINTFEIEITNGKLLLELEYTNDEVLNGIDRNAILKNIELNKL